MDSVYKDEIITKLPPVLKDCHLIDMLHKEINREKNKIFVLDDDPTGIQTVSNVPVLTVWDEETIRAAFLEEAKLFYILTNSRGLKEADAEQLNRVITERICKISKEQNMRFTIISRSDSTLRGHYPIETETIREVIENKFNITVDGEVIIPFFKEGGRLTFDDIHWIEDHGRLIPAGESEFAKDYTFGYKNSNIKLWLEEKTEGRVKPSDVISISIDTIRNHGYKEVAKQLLKAERFQKIIVNAFEYSDLDIFTMGLLLAEQQGKNFLFRTAASFVKVRSGIRDKELLTRDELIKNNGNGGLIIVGSHVEKTTMQLHHALELNEIKAVEFNVPRIIMGEVEEEVLRVSTKVENELLKGNSILVYTSRNVLKKKNEKSEDNLDISRRVSEALVNVVKALKATPNFIIAKGGITSSDIGTKGLKVKRALAAGQIKPGIPVWITDNDSKFPNIPYIIFPGNVGNEYTLKEIISELQDQ